jgi:hypothetical protein
MKLGRNTDEAMAALKRAVELGSMQGLADVVRKAKARLVQLSKKVE